MPSHDIVPLLKRELAARQPAKLGESILRRAAVLAPLVFRSAEPHVLFTERTHNVATHKGQVSFPGGMIEDDDANPCAAALRETWEEIGVLPEQIEVLGQLDELITNSGTFAITPFVGAFEDGAAHIASPGEVARILEVPLAYLLDDAQREPDMVTQHWKYHWQGAVIWGATAKMLNELLHILGLVDPFAEDLVLLRSLADPEDQTRFTYLMRDTHPRRQSAAEYVRQHPSQSDWPAIQRLALGSRA